MNTENLRLRFMNAALEVENTTHHSIALDGDEQLVFLVKVFAKMFNMFPFTTSLNPSMVWKYSYKENESMVKLNEKEEEEGYLDSGDTFSFIDEDGNSIDFKIPKIHTDNILIPSTINNIIKEFEGEVFIYNVSGSCVLVTETFFLFNTFLICKEPYVPERVNKCIVFSTPSEKPSLKWVLASPSGGFTLRHTEVKTVDFNPNNYNTDLPDDKINDIIQGDSSSLIILHGKPGTGKTTYIRSLIKNNPTIDFYWLDSSLFTQIVNASFVSFLIDHKDGVFVLEDCESLLESRDISGNGLLSTLLNISDGMLGDSLNIKFICTFNSDLSNIDKALFRKGRLKLKYEFKDLTKDRVENLFENLNIDKSKAKEMPLCDALNFEEDNGAEVKSKRKIGFN